MSIITISRGSRSGGQALAEMVAAKLNYECVSREILVKAAEQYGIDEDVLIQFSEKPPKFWDRFKQDRKLYLYFIKAALLDHAQSGNLVYHGHSGQFLLKGVKCALKVRLIAPIEQRIEMGMEKQGLSRDATIQYIQKVDEVRVKWAKFMYGVDLLDPSHYDLVINLETMTLETACDMICSLTEAPEFRANLYCIKSLKESTLLTKVEAALASDTRTKTLDLLVEADGGKMTISGRIEAEKIRQPVLEIAKEVEGVNSVIDEMTIEKLTNIPT